MAKRPGNPSSLRSPRISLRDVAKHAGVSVATCSHVINGRSGVSEKSRLAVSDAIEQLQYIPNVIGKAVNGKPSGLIGVVVPIADPPLFPSIINGLSSEAENAGLPLFVSYSQDNINNERQSIQIFRQLFVNGIILAGHATEDNVSLIRDTIEHGVPVVQIERRIDGLNTPYVGSCNFEAAREITGKLLAKGHDSVGLIAGPAEYSVHTERMAGYREALSSCKCKFKPEWICRIDPQADAPDIQKTVEQYLRGDNAPRAFLCYNIKGPEMIIALEAVAEAGIENIEVVSFDMPHDLNTKGWSFRNVMQNGFAMGVEAMRVLSQMTDSATSIPDEIRLPCLPAEELQNR